jgi:hypothetical protein
LREDLEDELMTCLMGVAERYDPAQCAFWTYAYSTLRGRVRMYFRQRRREVSVGLMSDEGTVIDPWIGFSESMTEDWARRMLAEVGFLNQPAIDHLMGKIDNREAARRVGLNEDYFRRRLSAVKQSEAAEAFRVYVES